MAHKRVILCLMLPVCALGEKHVVTNATSVPPLTVVTLNKPTGSRRLSLTNNHKDAILEKHNALRAGCTLPCTAADMETLQWDEDLAAAAQTYASQCVWAHDPNNGNNGWGENLAAQWSSNGNNAFDESTLTGFVQSWYDEIHDTEWPLGADSLTSKTYTDPQNECRSYDAATGKCMIGHYTQVVWAKSSRLGCAAVTCDSPSLLGHGGVYLVCKYNPAGNVGSSGGIAPPYIPGTPCSSCSDKCSTGTLCNAGVTPNRCRNTNFALNLGGVIYNSCDTLIPAVNNMWGANYWCGNFEASWKLCPVTCGTCSVPSGFGVCPATSEPSPAPTKQPTVPTMAPTKAPTSAPTGTPTRSPTVMGATPEPTTPAPTSPCFDNLPQVKINNIQYGGDCVRMVQEQTWWCGSSYEAQYKWCPVTCGHCAASPTPAPGPARQTNQGCECVKTWNYAGQMCSDYCCNPDNDAGGEWCFTQGACSSNWGYCSSRRLESDDILV